MSTSKTFRLFISSTFNDFRKEREVLQTRVFPHIRSYCSEREFTFQPIDLRWGVSEEAQLNQKTLELCLEEVRACKSYPHPNFLIMIGDRYGWVPLPYAIETNEYKSILSHLSLDEKSKLNEWYQLDLNQIPASYLLKERTGKFIDIDIWASIETELRSLLQSGAKKHFLGKEGLEAYRKYFFSATESEVEEGIIPYIKPTVFQQNLLNIDTRLHELDSEYTFGFFRTIDTSTRIGQKFILDDDDHAKAQIFKKNVSKIFKGTNLLNSEGIRQLDADNLDDTYLNEFEERIISFLESQINERINKECNTVFTPLNIEIDAQSYYAQQKRKDFFETPELSSLLTSIQTYIDSPESDSAFVLYGPSGRGKSSLLSMAIDKANLSLTHQVLYRFVGSTPNSGSSKEILISMFDELGIDVRSEVEKVKSDKDEISFDTQKDQESFEDFSYRIHGQIMGLKESIVFFIDAIDQVSNDDQFLWLPKILPSNVKIIISVLNDESYRKDSRYFQTLKDKTAHLNEIPAFSDPAGLLKILLKKEHRTLQPHQEKYFLSQCATVNSPLYVLMAAQEIQYWKSTDRVEAGENPKEATGKIQALSNTQKGIIEKFLSNFIELHHHNPEFVHKVLGYLYASRDGLSESELLSFLSTDDTFIEMMTPDSFHKNLTKELPIVYWSRLHTQLKPFLSQKSQDNEELLYFFHREFEDAIKALPDQRTQHEALITASQKLITKHQYEPFDSNRWGKLYSILITEYELRFFTKEEQKTNYNQKKKQKEFAEFIATLANEEWIEIFTDQLHTDGWNHKVYNRTNEANAFLESHLHITSSLFVANPNQWEASYTGSLNSLATSYDNVSRTKDAIRLQEKALSIDEILYAQNPERWAGDYTLSLNNLAVSYGKVSRTKDEISLQEKALSINETLYAQNPERWAGDYTLSLNNLAVSYGKVSRTKDAISLQEKALSITETLYAQNPERWAEDYTDSLNNLATSYDNVSRTKDAISLQEKALSITETLYAQNPERWAEDYTYSLNNLALSYGKVSRTKDAISLQEKALSITETLYAQNPERWAEDYTGSLNSLANLYRDVNRTEEAISLKEKSLSIREALYTQNPEPWAEDYTYSLNSLAASYSDVNRIEEAISLQEKSLSIREALYTQNPERWAEYYANSLSWIANFYYKANRFNEAVVLEEKALSIYEILYAKNPDQWSKNYWSAKKNIDIFKNPHKYLKNRLIVLSILIIGIIVWWTIR